MSDYCSQCNHKDTCKEAYEKLGTYQGPSVAWEVAIAFVLPIAVFIAGTAACRHLLSAYVGERSLILASFACGLLSAGTFAAGIRLTRRRLFSKHSSSSEFSQECSAPAGGGPA